MRSGRLRHQVVIQSLVPVQDATTGEIANTWTLFSTERAEVRSASLREFIAGGIEDSKVTLVVTIRYRAGIKPSMRVLHGDRIYNIENALPDYKSMREYMVLPCSEIIKG